MTVDLSMIQEILELYYHNVEYEIDEEMTDCLSICIECEGYYALANLILFDTPEGAVMHTQTASYTLVFTDQKGEPLEFQHKDYSELAVLTTELQQHCGWGILSPAKIPDGSVEVTLYREFRVCADDLTLAKAGNPRSELLTAIVELPGELIHVAGILQNYETTPNFDVTLIDHILAPTTQTALS